VRSKRNIRCRRRPALGDVDVPTAPRADTPRHGTALCDAVAAIARNERAPMEFRQFGRTGLEGSPQSLRGCWEIGGTYVELTRASSAGRFAQSDRSASTVFDNGRGLSWGVRGGAARALGGRRNNAVIRDQIWRRYEEMPNRRDSSGTQSSARRQEPAAICAPIMSTSISCIGPIRIRRWTRRYARSDDVVRQGKARLIGVSNFRLAQIEELRAAPPHRRRAIRLEHVRPPYAGRDIPLLCGAADRGHGLRLAGVTHASGPSRRPCRSTRTTGARAAAIWAA